MSKVYGGSPVPPGSLSNRPEKITNLYIVAHSQYIPLLLPVGAFGGIVARSR